MMDVASLAIAIDSSSVRNAVADLNVWNASVSRADKTSGAAARTIKSMGDEVRGLGGVLANAYAEASKAGNNYKNVAGQLTSYRKSLINITNQVADAGPPVNGSGGEAENSLSESNLKRLKGRPTFQFLVDHASETGVPLEKSDSQVAAEIFNKFLKFSKNFLRGTEAKMALDAVSGVVDWGISDTDYSKLNAAKDKIDEKYAYSKKRNEESGGKIKTYQDDFQIAAELKELSDTIIKPRLDIVDKYNSAKLMMKSFQNEYSDFDAFTRMIAAQVRSPYHNFAASYELLKNKLEKGTARSSDVQNAYDELDKVMPLLKTPEDVARAEKLKATFHGIGDQVSAELDSIEAMAQQSRTAVQALSKRYSGDGKERDLNAGQQPTIKTSAADIQSTIQNLSTAATSVRINDGKPKSIVDASQSKLVSDQTAAVRDLNQTDQTYTEQTKLGTQASVQSAAATDNVKSKVVTLKQSQDDLQKSGAAQLAQMPQLTKAANDQADAYRRAAEAQELQKLAGDIQFQQEQMGRSTVDQTVASTQKQYGLPVDMNSASAGIIRYNEQLKYARELAGDFASTLVSGLRNGEGLWKSLGKAAISVLTKISDRLLNDVLNSLFKVNSAAAGGGGGIFGGLFGGGGGLDLGILARSPQAASAIASGSSGLFADGGYTGPGGIHDPAGVVHAGEVVWSQKDISRAGGVGVVEAMRLGRRGYADGGVVGEGGPQFARVQPDAPVPTHRLKAGNQNEASGSGSGVHVTVGVSVDEDGNLKAYVKNVAQSEAQTSTRQGLNDYNQQLPDRVAQINRNPRRR
ncbi:hypothetical protein HB780_18425 [Rhizobium lusitanum]|uniref:hypothetical protein n=1 Tax=Rhizobium lusitanum TaxID=293958 RepID=UPI00161D2911|nr:hypothetical protein [Rhizobium lusitanum]QND47654.1 hypothetical protein HB780_18425 [Rhizobium lusitanum]